MIDDNNSLTTFSRIELGTISLMMPVGTEYVEFGKEDTSSIRYSLYFPVRDKTMKVKAEHYESSAEEMNKFAVDRYEINAPFSPEEFNQPPTPFLMDDPTIAAIDFHYSNGKYPALFMHIILAFKDSMITKFHLAHPIQEMDEVDAIFEKIVRSLQQDEPLVTTSSQFDL